MVKPVVFLDTSIFIAALLSAKGGSFYILNNLGEKVDLQTNEYVLKEIEDVLQNKFSHKSDMRTQLFLLLGTADVNILPNRPKPEITEAKKYISEKDAPILAAALANSDYLLTLDNEFFGEKIVEMAESKGLRILKPKGLIELLRQ